MNDYIIAICLKSNSSRVVGTFLNNDKGAVKLGSAFFESNPGLVFPTIVVSESDITGVEKMTGNKVGETKEKVEPSEVGKTESQKTGRMDDVPTDSTKPSKTAPEQGDIKVCSGATEALEQTKEMVEHKIGSAEGNEEEEGDWDQFKANSKLFNIDGKFDEGEYMDVLDKNSESYKSKLLMAKRIEREIMSSPTSDLHRLEERGFGGPGDDDAYSTVINEKKGKKHRREGRSPKTEMPIQRETSARSQQKPTTDADTKSPGGESVKKKMVIEIEGFSMDGDGKGAAAKQDVKVKESFVHVQKRKEGDQSKRKGTEGRKSDIAEKNKELKVDSGVKQEEKGNGKRNITYGWMSTKFESSRSIIETIRSKFKQVFEIGEGNLKWGTGPSWETVGRNAISKSTRFNKSSSILKHVSRKSPVSK